MARFAVHIVTAWLVWAKRVLIFLQYYSIWKPQPDYMEPAKHVQMKPVNG